MNIMVLVRYIEAILEIVFLVLTIFYFIKEFKTKNYKKVKIYGMIYLVLNFIRHICSFTRKEAAAISIIGGADGPTSVFLAGKVGSSFNLVSYLLGFFVVLLGIGILLYIRKKK